jgi:hypothetical protein
MLGEVCWDVGDSWIVANCASNNWRRLSVDTIDRQYVVGFVHPLEKITENWAPVSSNTTFGLDGEASASMALISNSRFEWFL